MKAIIRIILILLSICVLGLFLITILFMFQKSSGVSPTIMGYTAFVNEKESVNGEEGDFVIVKEENGFSKYDVVAFENEDEVVELGTVKDKSGKKYIIKATEDTSTVPLKDIYGKVVISIPKVGMYLTYIKTHDNYTWYALGCLLIASIAIKFGFKNVR